jgi:hypothetical protein
MCGIKESPMMSRVCGANKLSKLALNYLSVDPASDQGISDGKITSNLCAWCCSWVALTRRPPPREVTRQTQKG